MYSLNQFSFSANYLDVTKEDDLYIFGIADDAENPKHYVIIQYSGDNDEQEIALDHDKEYFESSFIDKGYYGAVKKITFYRSKILIYIEDKFGSLRSIDVDIKKCIKTSDEMYNILKEIHNNTQSQIFLNKL